MGFMGGPKRGTLGYSRTKLVMFQEPNAYIASSWYGHEEVPTWNYQASMYMVKQAF